LEIKSLVIVILSLKKFTYYS